MSCYVGCDHDASVSCALTLQHSTDSNKPPHKKEWATTQMRSPGAYGWHQYISRQTMSNFCLPDGMVIFHLEILEKKAIQPNARTITRSICQPRPIIAAADTSAFPQCQYLNAESADMTIIVEGERLPAHTNIVCPRSAVFQAMFQHPMQEAATKEVHTSDEYGIAAARAMLHFLYAGMIPPDILQAQAPQLLALASYYQIDDLQDYLENSLNISLDNIMELLQAAQLHGSREFLQRVLQFVIGHCQQLSKQQEFLESLDCRTISLLFAAMAGTPPADQEQQVGKQAASAATERNSQGP